LLFWYEDEFYPLYPQQGVDFVDNLCTLQKI